MAETSRPTLFGYGASTFTRMARVAFEEKGVDHDFVAVASWDGYRKDPAHLGLHPFAKVPVLRHGAETITETLAIVAYVDEAFDGPALQPATPIERARMRELISTTISYAWPAWVRVLATERLFQPLVGAPSDEARIRAAAAEARRAAEAAAARRRRRGGAPRDLAAAGIVGAGWNKAATPEGAEILRAAPAFRAWWARMTQRPSVAKVAPKTDWSNPPR